MPEDQDKKERLSKIMAEQKLCSRREADEFIKKGWVAVDGQVISVLGTKIHRGQKISLSPSAQAASRELVTVLLNKPIGFVSGQPEPGYQPAVVLLTPEHYYGPQQPGRPFRASHLRGLAPAGRLDIDSQGLLVFTQDGRIARQLIGPESTVEKEYLVCVSSRPLAGQLSKLRHGLVLDHKPLLPAKVEPLADDCLKIILIEGRKRQIRKMCSLVGLQVTKLKRVRIGQVHLGSLPLGKWRYLGKSESF